MTKKKKRFCWSEQKDNKLRTIFDKIKNLTLLAFPDLNQPYQLEMDASDLGGGAILHQNEKIVGIYSVKWSEVESNYTCTEKETLKIIKALEHFRTLTFGSHIQIFTDNANCIYPKSLNQRAQRWKLYLENYSYELKHRKGVFNKEADALFRINAIQNPTENAFLNITEISTKQHFCDRINSLKEKGKTKEISVNRTLLILDLEDKLLIPDSYSFELLKAFNLKLEHPSKNSFYLTLSKYLNIDSLQKQISSINNNCSFCQEKKYLKSILAFFRVI